MALQFLTYQNIDKAKWDYCVQHAANSLIYGYSFYLDAMAENWNGIVLNDYEAVMPLPWRKKWGIAYLYQPAFIQQGGIFFSRELDTSVSEDFLSLALQHYKFAEFTLNYANRLSELQDWNMYERNNYVMLLNKPYDSIREMYNPAIGKSIKRASKHSPVYTVSKNYREVLQLYKSLYHARLPYFSNADFENFASICEQVSTTGDLIVRQVFSENSGEILAAVILLKNGGRLYNMVSCITAAGRAKEINYYLYDQLVREFCESCNSLDFEGSDVPGIAFFYQRFTMLNQPYLFVKANKLHPFIRLFKH